MLLLGMILAGYLGCGAIVAWGVWRWDRGTMVQIQTGGDLYFTVLIWWAPLMIYAFFGVRALLRQGVKRIERFFAWRVPTPLELRERRSLGGKREGKEVEPAVFPIKPVGVLIDPGEIYALLIEQVVEEG